MRFNVALIEAQLMLLSSTVVVRVTVNHLVVGSIPTLAAKTQ